MEKVQLLLLGSKKEKLFLTENTVEKIDELIYKLLDVYKIEYFSNLALYVNKNGDIFLGDISTNLIVSDDIIKEALERNDKSLKNYLEEVIEWSFNHGK